MKDLLKDKADPNIESKVGISPIHLASTCTNDIKGATIIGILLELGANIDKKTKKFKNTALHCACDHQQTTIVDTLLKQVRFSSYVYPFFSIFLIL